MENVTFKIRTTSLALSPLLLLASVVAHKPHLEIGMWKRAWELPCQRQLFFQPGWGFAGTSSNYRFDSASYDHTGTLGGRVAIGWRTPHRSSR